MAKAKQVHHGLGIWLAAMALAACGGGGDPPIGEDAPSIDTPGDIDAAVDIDAPMVSCEPELPCAAPSPGRSTICGRLADTETTQTIVLPGADGGACNPAQPTATGPCSLRITLYDALQFSMNPQTAPVLVPGELYVDSCGRYAAREIPATSFGFIAVVIDDAPGVPDTHIVTGISVDIDDASPAASLPAYATRRTTDEAWSASANLSPSFATRGVMLVTFRYQGEPRPGVQIRRAGQPIPNDDFYFSNPATRTTIAAAQNNTGPNGSVLTINVSGPVPDIHDGIGNEPGTCRWPGTLLTTTPGVVFVHDLGARTPTGAACP